MNFNKLKYLLYKLLGYYDNLSMLDFHSYDKIQCRFVIYFNKYRKNWNYCSFYKTQKKFFIVEKLTTAWMKLKSCGSLLYSLFFIKHYLCVFDNNNEME